MRKRNDEVMVDMAPGPTVMAPQHRPRIWLEFDDGSAVGVRGAGLIGRDPAPATGDRFEHLITLADDTLSVSRTHLEFGTGESGLWIRDRSSTNGSVIEMNGHRATVPPGMRVPAPAGSTIHIGAHHVTVRNIPAFELINVAAIEWGAASHAGAVHEHRQERNQDAHCAGPPVFVVADGMGGHCAGDVASREVIEALLPLVGRVPVTGAMVTACLTDARARIARIAVDSGRPPGSTLSGVIATRVDGVPSWVVVNIGDSRTYRLDSDDFRQLTVDHTVVRELIDAGAITPSAAASYPARNLLTRALLGATEHPADISVLAMRAGDRILVCSDGLTRELDDGLIADVLRTTPDPHVAAESLITAAIGGDGHDDLTAVVVDVLAIRDHRSEAVGQNANSGLPFVRPARLPSSACLRFGANEFGIGRSR